MLKWFNPRQRSLVGREMIVRVNGSVFDLIRVKLNISILRFLHKGTHCTLGEHALQAVKEGGHMTPAPQVVVLFIAIR